MSEDNKHSEIANRYEKELNRIKEIKEAFHDDIKVWNDLIWRRKLQEMIKEPLDKEKRGSLYHYKNELEENGNGLERDLKNVEETINSLLNFVAQNADFDSAIGLVENLGFQEESLINRPTNVPIPIAVQYYAFEVVSLISNILIDITKIYEYFCEVQELFDDVKGLYELKRKVSKMSMDYFRLREHFESGKKEIMNKNDAIMNMHTNLIFNKMNEDKAKYFHRRLSRSICVTQIQRAFTTYNKSYFGAMKKIKKSDSYLRDMLSGWNTYLRTNRANGESHRPLDGYEEKVFESDEVFYNWAPNTLVPYFYEIEEKKEANIKERDNRKNIKNDTQYENGNRQGRRRISGSHEPLNISRSLNENDNNELLDDGDGNDSMHYFDDPMDLDVNYMAEIVGKRLVFPGTLDEFCKKFGYKMDVVESSLGKAGKNLTMLLTAHKKS